MCNIAGYIGNRPAAPILIEMMRRQEGWGGGCYTGIATMHEGKIHYAKLTGDLDHLIENTCAAQLPGNVGILHSRTPSGGGDEWAHPFVAESGGNIRMAYIANGEAGFFRDRIGEMGDMAIALEKKGYVFRSAQKEAVGSYPRLANGGSVHMSDVMAQLIACRIDEGMDASSAMDRAFCEMPSEIVGLMLSLTAPDTIVWSRINMPMFAGFADHGAYLATTPQAFPGDAGEATLLPSCAGGRVFADRIEVNAYAEPPATVAPITPHTREAAYRAIESCIRGNACTFGPMAHAVTDLFESADCRQVNALVYRTLSALEKEGRLIVERETVPGVLPGLTAPVFRGKIID